MLTSGLSDIAKVLMIQENVPDGYGGLKKLENIIKRNYRCRKTMGTTEIYRFLEVTSAGLDRTNSWFVTGEYDADIKEGMTLQFRTPSNELENYEIVKVEAKKDNVGRYSHLLMIAEKI